MITVHRYNVSGPYYRSPWSSVGRSVGHVFCVFSLYLSACSGVVVFVVVVACCVGVCGVVVDVAWLGLLARVLLDSRASI
mgnify:CR=1 FL=1